MEQRANHVVRVDAADPIDLGSGAGLAIGDDRQRLEGRRRHSRHLAGRVAGKPLPHLGRRHELVRVFKALQPQSASGGFEL